MRFDDLEFFGSVVALTACALIACDLAVEDGGRGAVAVLEPTSGSVVEGTVRFESLGRDGVRVIADLQGLEAGSHAFHVHEFGDCREDAAAAGPHFDFQADADPAKRITGNLGELSPGPDGRTHLEATVAEAALDGSRSILGRAVVVHAHGNDPTEPPDGAAGERIACGVIEAADGDVLAGV